MIRTSIVSAPAALLVVASLVSCGPADPPAPAAPAAVEAAAAPAEPARAPVPAAKTLAAAAKTPASAAKAPAADAKARAPAAAPAAVASPGGVPDLGAASWIPDDVAWFSSTLLLGDQWRALTGSNVWRRILALPIIQMLRAQAMGHPAYAAFLEAREKDPLVSKGIEVLEDAFSREIFACAGGRAADFVDALWGMWGRLYFLFRVPGGDPRPADLVAMLLEMEKDLQAPPIVLGFRLGKPAAALELLGSIEERYGRLLPVPLAKEEISGGRYWHIRLSGEMVPPRVLDDALADLGREGVPAEDLEKLRSMVRSRTLAVSAGVRGDYLLLSASSDTAHLASFGSGKPLAASEALAPVRKRGGGRLCSLSYTCARLAPGGKMPVPDVVKFLEEALAGLLQVPDREALLARARRDAAALLEDLNRLVPEAGPMVDAGYLDRGFENFTWSPPDPTLPASARPLKVLARSGRDPLVLFASRLPPLAEAWSRLAHWAKVGFGYFQDLAPPRMPPADREQFERFRKLFVPAIGELSAATADLLLPALEGAEVLLVMDGEGKLPVVPGAAPLAIPRPALVLEVEDAGKVVAAFSRYREIANRFLKTSGGELSLEAAEIPPTEARPGAAGTVHAFPGTVLGPGIEPHALVATRTVIVGLWPAQSEALLASADPKAPPAGDLGAPAADLLRIHVGRLAGLVLEDAGVLIGQAARSGSFPPGEADLAAAHVPALREILGCVKSYTIRSFAEGGFTVRHSRLVVEDLAE